MSSGSSPIRPASIWERISRSESSMAKRLVASVERVSAVLDKFLEYQNRLIASAKQDSNIIGLVFAGSAADHSRVDEHSDQDFFLIVKNGLGEQYRKDLSWLPDTDLIVIRPRETAHGLKVVYRNGDLLEFAVFEDQELELGAANEYSVPVDKQNITERMRLIAERSNPKDVDRSTEWELFLSLTLIGVGRYRRGEVIAAEQHIKSYALDKALKLIRLANPVDHDRSDFFNSYRRFEFDYPELGETIAKLMMLDTETCARKLATLVAEEIRATTEELNQLEVVNQRLGWV